MSIHSQSFPHDQLREEDIKSVCEYMYRFILIKYIGYVVTFSLFIFLAQINQNLLIAAIPSAIAELTIFCLVICYQMKSSRYFMTFIVVECFFDIIFKIFLIICIREDFAKIYSLSSGIIHLILNFLSCKDQAKTVFLPHFFLTNILFYLSALFLFLRLDDMVSWKIYVCIWPCYFYLLMIFFLGTCKIRIAIGSFCLYCNKNIKKGKI
jgi:hypothetical protein